MSVYCMSMIWGLSVNGSVGWGGRNLGIKKARLCKLLADKIKLEPMIGIEPMTYSLRVNRDTLKTAEMRQECFKQP